MGAIQKLEMAKEIAEQIPLTPTEKEKFVRDLQKLNISSLRWLKEELEEKVGV